MVIHYNFKPGGTNNPSQVFNRMIHISFYGTIIIKEGFMEILIGIALILFGLKLIMKGEDGDSF